MQTPCILHPSKPSSNGYGQVYKDGKKQTAHRYAYKQTHGEIPDGMLVCHTCDVRRCVNPDHLYLGTHVDNNRDTYERNRMPLRYGALAVNVAKLTEEQAKDIKYSDTPTKELVEKYQVNPSQVSRIRTGKTWKNI